MIKVISIEKIEPYYLVCRFNNQVVKKLDIYPLIQQHKNLQGIDQLMANEIFNKARIGEMGEIVWDKIITTKHLNETIVWDYDISPEFAYEHASLIHANDYCR